MIQEVNEAVLREYFTRLDPLVKPGTMLYVFGGGAVALLGAKIRTTVDLDVAAPYSNFSDAEFAKASAEAGLPVNPHLGYQGAYVEFVENRMLALPLPASPDNVEVLFSGENLTVKTGSPADLVASKLCRYDEQDLADVQFLVRECGAKIEEVRAAVERMPQRMRDDVLVQENLKNLETDIAIWEMEK